MSEHVTVWVDGLPDLKRGEEIVRCGDCKRFDIDRSDHGFRSGYWCERWSTDAVYPDGFCAWGERK